MSVFWLALAAFAIGTESFVIAGLLPAIANDLAISVPAAGQLVTAYGLTYAVGSPILAVTLNNIDRRTVLVLALSTFIAGNLAAMVASSYALLLASRMLMALGSGLCMPTALAVSVAVASPERRGRAVALVTSGLTIATVAGVPLGKCPASSRTRCDSDDLPAVVELLRAGGQHQSSARGLPPVRQVARRQSPWERAMGRAVLQRVKSPLHALRQRPSQYALAIRAGCSRACGEASALPSSVTSRARR